MKLVNIEYDYDFDDVLQQFEGKTDETIAEIIGEPSFLKLNHDEQNVMLYAWYRRSPGAVDDFLNLPTEFEVPKDIEDFWRAEDCDDSILLDWLEESFGWYISSYDVET